MPWKKRIFPAWARTVGAMLERGAAVRVYCRKCKNFFDVDLVAIRGSRSAEQTLIDASTACRISSCRGRGYFAAAESMTAKFLLLVRVDMLGVRERVEDLRPLDVEPPDSSGPPPAETMLQDAA